MEVDSKIEPLVRQVLDAAVKADAKRFGDNLKAFKDEESARKGLDLAVRICMVLLYAEYGQRPTSEELERLVATVAEQESRWSELRPEEYRESLDAMLDNRPANMENPGLAVAPFVLAAFLLAGTTQKPKWWFETLDEVLARIEIA